MTKHRLPQPCELGREEAPVDTEVDRVGSQARDGVELEQCDVQCDAVHRVAAIRACKRVEVDVLVPDSGVKAQIVERAARGDAGATSYDLGQAQHAHVQPYAIRAK